MLAALVGLVAERRRLFPVFPWPNERPEVALDRERPLLAILMDVTVENAESDLFIKRAAKLGAQVIVFGHERVVAARRDWAAANGVGLFGLPAELDPFEEALEALAAGRGSALRTPEWRAPPD